jgi:hypothetical protein
MEPNNIPTTIIKIKSYVDKYTDFLKSQNLSDRLIEDLQKTFFFFLYMKLAEKLNDQGKEEFLQAFEGHKYSDLYSYLEYFSNVPNLDALTENISRDYFLLLEKQYISEI